MTLKDRLSELTDWVRHRWMYRKGSTTEQGAETSGGTHRGRLWVARLWDRLAGLFGGGATRRNWVWRIGRIALVLLLLYYPIGMMLTHEIDDDLTFRPAANDQTDGGSKAVDMLTALIDREVDAKRWTANDPFFLPSSQLDNMPNFQQGVIAALARFTFELTDQLGRTRGSSQADADLQSAAGSLQYAGDVWMWNPSVSPWPQATAEAKYREAGAALRSYNRRLAQGNAVFDKRGDNLLATLDRIALDLGSSSAALDTAVVERAGSLIDTQADDLFYSVKGQTYAYYLILNALGSDFETLIAERELNKPWAQMLASMAKAASLDPWVVVNADPDAQLMPSHLAAQGFYLLRARTQLREITNILLK